MVFIVFFTKIMVDPFNKNLSKLCEDFMTRHERPECPDAPWAADPLVTINV